MTDIKENKLFNLLKLFGIKTKEVDITYGDSEIMPCPHCGASGYILVSKLGISSVHCSRCCLGALHKEDAIKNWNRRR